MYILSSQLLCFCNCICGFNTPRMYAVRIQIIFWAPPSKTRDREHDRLIARGMAIFQIQFYSTNLYFMYENVSLLVSISCYEKLSDSQSVYSLHSISFQCKSKCNQIVLFATFVNCKKNCKTNTSNNRFACLTLAALSVYHIHISIFFISQQFILLNTALHLLIHCSKLHM